MNLNRSQADVSVSAKNHPAELRLKKCVLNALIKMSEIANLHRIAIWWNLKFAVNCKRKISSFRRSSVDSFLKTSQHALVGFLVAAAQAHASDCTDYGKDLQLMLQVDNAVRERLDPAQVLGSKRAPPELERVQLIDRVNTARLEAWIQRCGWPRRTTHGEAAVGAAWLLTQHADQSPAFQARALDLIRQAVEAGEESASDLAYLSDRLAVANGQPQLYGTQGMIEGECKFRLLPIDDPVKVDQRRLSLKWPTIKEYEQLVIKTTFGDRCDVHSKP